MGRAPPSRDSGHEGGAVGPPPRPREARGGTLAAAPTAAREGRSDYPCTLIAVAAPQPAAAEAAAAARAPPPHTHARAGRSMSRFPGHRLLAERHVEPPLSLWRGAARLRHWGRATACSRGKSAQTRSSATRSTAHLLAPPLLPREWRRASPEGACLPPGLCGGQAHGPRQQHARAKPSRGLLLTRALSTRQPLARAQTRRHRLRRTR